MDSAEKPQGRTSPVANFGVAHFLPISSILILSSCLLAPLPCKNYISKTSLEDGVLKKVKEEVQIH